MLIDIDLLMRNTIYLFHLQEDIYEIIFLHACIHLHSLLLFSIDCSETSKNTICIYMHLYSDFHVYICIHMCIYVHLQSYLF